jgi:hypothetical protein
MADLPIKLNLSIPAASLKKIVEGGRTMEFVDKISTYAKAYIAEQLVNNIHAGYASGISITTGFDDDAGFGNNWPKGPKGPKGPRGPWVSGMSETYLREGMTEVAVVNEVAAPRVLSEATKSH